MFGNGNDDLLIVFVIVDELHRVLVVVDELHQLLLAHLPSFPSTNRTANLQSLDIASVSTLSLPAMCLIQ
jgi:hypothetical protein